MINHDKSHGKILFPLREYKILILFTFLYTTVFSAPTVFGLPIWLHQASIIYRNLQIPCTPVLHLWIIALLKLDSRVDHLRRTNYSVFPCDRLLVYTNDYIRIYFVTCCLLRIFRKKVHNFSTVNSLRSIYHYLKISRVNAELKNFNANA